MPTLQQRRIYQSGKNSLAITLPLGWVRYLGLKPGDVVDVIANGEVIIRPKCKTVKGTLLRGIDSSDG